MARTPEQRKRDSDEATKRFRHISNQWKEFAKTEAYKEYRDYIDLQDYLAVTAAKGPINTFDNNSGEQLNFDPVKGSALLQRSVGYDIVKLYVDGYVNPDTL